NTIATELKLLISRQQGVLSTHKHPVSSKADEIYDNDNCIKHSRARTRSTVSSASLKALQRPCTSAFARAFSPSAAHKRPSAVAARSSNVFAPWDRAVSMACSQAALAAS